MSAEVANGPRTAAQHGGTIVIGANRLPHDCANDEHFQFEPDS